MKGGRGTGHQYQIYETSTLKVRISLSKDVNDLLGCTSHKAQVWRTSACTNELHNVFMPNFPVNHQL